MTLLAPAALWMSLIGAAVVALYLLKIKRRRQTVPALEFWLQLAGQKQVRSLFQRLKRWVSLALWLLIVACLVMAIGNPVLSLGKTKPQAIVVIVDNSASMQTLEPSDDGLSRTRLAMAIDAVGELTSRRPISDEWLLIEAGRQPRVLAPWTMDRKTICDAAAAITPHLGSADLAPAQALAEQLLTGKERPCIVLVSDGSAGQAATLTAKNPTSVYWPIGKTSDNLGIVRLRVRADREQSAHHAYINVVNASEGHVDTQVVFELDGSTTSVEPISIDGRASWEKTIPINAPQGGVLRAWIDRSDSLVPDNEAFAVLEPVRKATVVLVAPASESFYFEQALAAMEALVDVDASRTLTVEEYDRAGPAHAGADLTIFNNCRPALLPKTGQFVFINDWPADVPAKFSGVMEGPEMSMVQRDHPLCRYVNAAAVSLARAKRVDLPERATIVARSSDGSPLIFLIEHPDRAILCLAFDVLESDLPFRNAFPLLLRNTVSYLVTQQAAVVPDQCRIADTIEPLRKLPEDVTEVAYQLQGQAADRAGAVPVRNGTFVFDRTQRAGPVRFSIGADSVYTAINLTDAAETRIEPDKAGRPPQDALALTGRLFGTVPWVALAVLATALVGVEWLTYHRRWTE